MVHLSLPKLGKKMQEEFNGSAGSLGSSIKSLKSRFSKKIARRNSNGVDNLFFEELGKAEEFTLEGSSTSGSIPTMSPARSSPRWVRRDNLPVIVLEGEDGDESQSFADDSDSITIAGKATLAGKSMNSCASSKIDGMSWKSNSPTSPRSHLELSIIEASKEFDKGDDDKSIDIDDLANYESGLRNCLVIDPLFEDQCEKNANKHVDKQNSGKPNVGTRNKKSIFRHSSQTPAAVTELRQIQTHRSKSKRMDMPERNRDSFELSQLSVSLISLNCGGDPKPRLRRSKPRKRVLSESEMKTLHVAQRSFGAWSCGNSLEAGGGSSHMAPSRRLKRLTTAASDQTSLPFNRRRSGPDVTPIHTANQRRATKNYSSTRPATVIAKSSVVKTSVATHNRAKHGLSSGRRHRRSESFGCQPVRKNVRSRAKAGERPPSSTLNTHINSATEEDASEDSEIISILDLISNEIEMNSQGRRAKPKSVHWGETTVFRG